MPNFLEFWIIDRNGITLYHNKKDKVAGINKNLFSGFVSAFVDIINVSSSENVESIKFKDSKLIMIATHVHEKLLFIARTNLKAKDRNIRKELTKLSELFHEEFGEELASWVGEMDTFEDFGKYLESFW